MIRNNNHQPNILFLLACIYYLADLLLPALQYWSSVYVNIFIILLILFSALKKNAKRTLKFISPFSLIVLIQLIDGLLIAENTKSTILTFYRALNFILPIIICYYLISNNLKNHIRVLVFVIIGFIAITSITSIIGLLDYPMASRQLATGMSGDPNLMVYYSKNIGGFEIAYMIPIVLPIIFAMYGKDKLKFIQLLVLIVPMIYFIYASQYVIALFSLIVSLTSILFSRYISSKKIWFIVFAILVIVLLYRSSIADLLYYLAGNNSSTVLLSRFSVLGDKIMGLEMTQDVYRLREFAYITSINTFLSNPIFGGVISGSGKIGGHSFILDLLASYGVIGIIVLFVTFKQIFKYLYRPFKEQNYYGYMLWSFILSIFLSIINTSANIFAIGLFVPTVAFYLQCKYRLEIAQIIKQV